MNKEEILKDIRAIDDKDNPLLRCDNEGKALLYVVEKTAERTKREVIEKAVEWLSNNMFNSINNGVIINGYCVSDFIGRFKRAMQDERNF